MDVHYLMHGVPFVWDAAKAAANVRKHGVSFETACEAFFDPFLRLAEAGEHHEERLAFLGATERGRLLFVVYPGRRPVPDRVRQTRHPGRTERV